MKHLKIFEHIKRSEIKDYFYDFMDNFEYRTFVIGQDELGKFEVFISLDYKYWYKNKQEISYTIHRCCIHLTESTGLYKSHQDNYDARIDGHECRIIRKIFTTHPPMDVKSK